MARLESCVVVGGWWGYHKITMLKGEGEGGMREEAGEQAVLLRSRATERAQRLAAPKAGTGRRESMEHG